MLYDIGLNSLATDNGVNRHVLCIWHILLVSSIHKKDDECMQKISNCLLPHTKEYVEI